MRITKVKDGYWHHNHAVSKCLYHIVFCTKYRRPVLDAKMQKRIHVLVKSKQQDLRFQLVEMETMPDHVHLLLQCDPSLGINSIIRRIKGYLAKMLRDEFPSLKSRLPCLWTRGRFIATVGTVSLERVKQYIQEQKNV